MNTLIEFTTNNGKSIVIDATDIESINQWTDGFREFGSKIVTKSGNTYIVKNDVHNVENSVIHALKSASNAQNSGNSYLTLRDQFAMAALPACVGLGPFGTGFSKQIALDAYKIADYMLAVRAEEGGES